MSLAFTKIAFAENAKLVLPRIMPSNQVVLGSSVTDSLKNHTSDFKLFELSHFSKTSLEFGVGHPMAVVGDFNGDGFRDIVVYGYSSSKKTSLILGAISDIKNKKYHIHEVIGSSFREEEFKNNSRYLKSIAKRSVPIAVRDYVQIETYGVGDSSSLGMYYSVKNKRFDQLIDSMD